MTVERWYVYQVCVAGYVLYVGKGSGQRYRTSARERGGIGGIVEYFKREADALKREVALIAELTPPLNRTKGGEGKTLKSARRSISDAQWATRQRNAAYRRADKGGWLNLLFAACHARCEINSRGIKGWPAEDDARVRGDPKVAEAIRRLNVWKQSPVPESLRLIISSPS